MIIYQGIKIRNKQYNLCLSNNKGNKIEIPIDEATGKRISAYLDHFCDSISVIAVERGNDEPNEE